MDKHTPGPWTIKGTFSGLGGTAIAVCVDNGILAGVAERCEPAEAEANARLIAAAPELLAAVQIVAAALRKVDGDGIAKGGCGPLADELEAVAARAMGCP